MKVTQNIFSISKSTTFMQLIRQNDLAILKLTVEFLSFNELGFNNKQVTEQGHEKKTIADS